MELSISIVSFNTKDAIGKCISSILKYTKNVSFEVIVVDNASTDGTQDYISKNFPKIKLIKNKRNNYYTKANNQALKIAKGKYFLILNADTYFKNNSIRKIIEYLDKHPEVGAVEGLEIYENGNLLSNGSMLSTPLIDFFELSLIGNKMKIKKLIDKYRIKNKNRRGTFLIEVGCDAFLAVRTDVLREIGGYDEKLFLYYTENDLCLRIIKNGYKIVHFGSAYVYHKVSLSANKLKWRKLDLYYSDLWTYYKKNNYYISGFLLFVLLKIEQLVLRLFRPYMFD